MSIWIMTIQCCLIIDNDVSASAVDTFSYCFRFSSALANC